MLHHSCDRCRRLIDPEDDVRYVVRMEVQAVIDGGDENGGIDSDRDHLLEVHEILERMDDLESEMIGEEVFQRRRFDLCPECYQKFNRQPVGREASAHLDFSQN